MNTRNHLHFLLLTVTWVSLYCRNQQTFADGVGQPEAAVPAEEKACKKYVHEHHGRPGKGVDTIKIVYVECPRPR